MSFGTLDTILRVSFKNKTALTKDCKHKTQRKLKFSTLLCTKSYKFQFVNTANILQTNFQQNLNKISYYFALDRYLNTCKYLSMLIITISSNYTLDFTLLIVCFDVAVVGFLILQLLTRKHTN